MDLSFLFFFFFFSFGVVFSFLFFSPDFLLIRFDVRCRLTAVMTKASTLPLLAIGNHIVWVGVVVADCARAALVKAPSAAAVANARTIIFADVSGFNVSPRVRSHALADKSEKQRRALIYLVRKTKGRTEM